MTDSIGPKDHPMSERLLKLRCERVELLCRKAVTDYRLVRVEHEIEEELERQETLRLMTAANPTDRPI